MPIKYRMEKNSLKPGTFYARVVRGKTVRLKQMISNIVAKTTLDRVNVEIVVMALIAEVIAILVAGDSAIIDGLVRFNTSISGSFESNEAIVTRDNVRLNVLAHGNRALASAVVSKASYSREASRSKAPLVDVFFDAAAKVYDRYTPGSIVCLKGENLKFNPDNDDEGVFISDGATEIRLTPYVRAGNKQIDTQIPPGASGALTITVRARYTRNGDLRQGIYRYQVTEV